MPIEKILLDSNVLGWSFSQWLTVRSSSHPRHRSPSPASRSSATRGRHRVRRVSKRPDERSVGRRGRRRPAAAALPGPGSVHRRRLELVLVRGRRRRRRDEVVGRRVLVGGSRWGHGRVVVVGRDLVVGRGVVVVGGQRARHGAGHWVAAEEPRPVWKIEEPRPVWKIYSQMHAWR